MNNSQPSSISLQILRKIGIVLIFFGFVDIGLMVYCLTLGIPFSSSFNIFAVIAGYFLLEESFRAARIVSFFAGFYLAGFVGVLLLFPLLYPLDLLVLQIRQSDLLFSALISIYGIIVLILIFWIYKALKAPEIAKDIETFGQGKLFSIKPSKGLPFGIILVVFLALVFFYMQNSGTANKVLEEAQKLTGPNWKYFISSLSYSSNGESGKIDAEVIAFNENEYKSLEVSLK